MSMLSLVNNGLDWALRRESDRQLNFAEDKCLGQGAAVC